MSEACDEIPIHRNQSQTETKRVRGTITAQIHPKSSIRHRFVTSFHLASDPSLFLCLYPSFCVYRKPELYSLSIFLGTPDWRGHQPMRARSAWGGRCVRPIIGRKDIALFDATIEGGAYGGERVAIPVWILSCYSKVTLKRTNDDALLCQSVENKTIRIKCNCNTNLLPWATNHSFLYFYKCTLPCFWTCWPTIFK